MRALKYRMKNIGLRDFENFFRFFKKYLPYALAIVFLKLCVVFFMLETATSGDDLNSFIKENDYPDVNNYLKDVKSVSRDEDVETITLIGADKWEVLNHLNETVLRPSSQNRTPHDSIWLLFNRIPRTGGQTLVSLMQALGDDLDFQHQEHQYNSNWRRLLSSEEQKNLASWFEYNNLAKSYDRFALYVNFTKHRSSYLRTKPAYITLLRDPVDKFISYFLYKRLNPELYRPEMDKRTKRRGNSGRQWYWRSVDDCVLEKVDECYLVNGSVDRNYVSAIPFLCGQEEMCLKHGNKWALQKAKYNLEFEYSVVGVIEDLNKTLSVLEHYVPLFFRGAYQRFWSEQFPNREINKNTLTYHHHPIHAMVRKILKNNFALEYELYEFAVQRLNRQHAKIAHLIPKTSPLPPRPPIPKYLSSLEKFQIELKKIKEEKKKNMTFSINWNDDPDSEKWSNPVKWLKKNLLAN